MLGGLFRMGCNLPMWPVGKIIGGTRPFREIPISRKGRGQTGRGHHGKSLGKVGRELYILNQFC